MDEDCPHCVFEITEANCRGCFEGSHYKPKQITNADRIRSLSDEELAIFLANPVKKDMFPDVPYCMAPSYVHWFYWLREEAKEMPMGSKTEIKTLEPCPLCGSEVKAKEFYRWFPPETNPYDDKIWLFQARFEAYCENCFLTQDVAQNFPEEDEKHGKAAVKQFFLEREQFWNRRKVEGDC